MPKQYRKLPVVIEAIQFDGNNSADIHEFCGDKVLEPMGYQHLNVVTLEGMMMASPGDYIIKGVKGEFYPCKPDIFEQTYQSVEEEGIQSSLKFTVYTNDTYELEVENLTRAQFIEVLVHMVADCVNKDFVINKEKFLEAFVDTVKDAVNLKE